MTDCMYLNDHQGESRRLFAEWATVSEPEKRKRILGAWAKKPRKGEGRRARR